MTTYATADRHPSAARHADEVILTALRAVLRDRSPWTNVDKNLVDAFTARLSDAGVDMWALDEAFADADEPLMEANR